MNVPSTILGDHPAHWLNPATWPWFVYVWAAFALAGFVKPAWEWFQRQRAGNWAAGEARIEWAEVAKPGFSFTTRRGHFVVKVGYSYSVSNTAYQGIYKREFPTEYEADTFARDLADRAVAVRHSPINPSRSLLLESDVEEMLQRRPPPLASEWVRPETSVPEWLKSFLWIFVLLSCVGLVVSLWVHLGAVMGRRVAPEPFFWILHIGIFVVWFPAVFVAQRLVGNMNRKDLWKVILKDSPT